jgi:hypothetical protein
MDFNVSVIKLVFVASTVNLLFNHKLNSANFNTNPNRHHINEKSVAFIRGRRLFEGGVYLSKMGKLGSVPALRTRRLECLLTTAGSN